jgi:hypothetical protein
MRAEAVVQRARKLDTAPRRAMPMVDTRGWIEESPWPRRSRLVFILGAAAACWAVPLLLAYWLAR